MITPDRNPRSAYDPEGNEIAPMILGGMRRLGIPVIIASCMALGCGQRLRST